MSQRTAMWLNFALGGCTLGCLLLSWFLASKYKSKTYDGWAVILTGPASGIAALIAMQSIGTGSAIRSQGPTAWAATRAGVRAAPSHAGSVQMTNVAAAAPAAPAAGAGGVRLMVQVPAGLAPGDHFQVQSPATGQLATIAVPAGAAPGTTIAVNLPPPAPAPVAVVAVALK